MSHTKRKYMDSIRDPDAAKPWFSKGWTIKKGELIIMTLTRKEMQEVASYSSYAGTISEAVFAYMPEASVVTVGNDFYAYRIRRTISKKEYNRRARLIGKYIHAHIPDLTRWIERAGNLKCHKQGKYFKRVTNAEKHRVYAERVKKAAR